MNFLTCASVTIGVDPIMVTQSVLLSVACGVLFPLGMMLSRMSGRKPTRHDNSVSLLAYQCVSAMVGLCGVGFELYREWSQHGGGDSIKFTASWRGRLAEAVIGSYVFILALNWLLMQCKQRRPNGTGKSSVDHDSCSRSLGSAVVRLLETLSALCGLGVVYVEVIPQTTIPRVVSIAFVSSTGLLVLLGELLSWKSASVAASRRPSCESGTTIVISSSPTPATNSIVPESSRRPLRDGQFQVGSPEYYRPNTPPRYVQEQPRRMMAPSPKHASDAASTGEVTV